MLPASGPHFLAREAEPITKSQQNFLFDVISPADLVAFEIQKKK